MISNNVELFKRTVITAMASDDVLLEKLVLKGGNAIVYGHKKDNRGSKDIDYSIEDEFGEEQQEIEGRIKSALESSFEEIGYIVHGYKVRERPKNLKEELVDFWGGYKVDFKLMKQELYNPEDTHSEIQRKTEVFETEKQIFTIEISKHEYCHDVKEEVEIDSYTVYVYPLKLIIAEKLRALCQQMKKYKEVIKSSSFSPRPRDFYDIYILMEDDSTNIQVTSTEFRELLDKVFQAKKVPIEWIKDIKNEFEFHNQGEKSLMDTIVGEKYEFAYYFEYVVKEVINKIELRS